ncbi:hypothetical protein CR205_02545 [Alteribacter lacisalsi]|uniref:HTH merR-type domain-containing protein n=1 Tax=Alteribacter lacisalsi TaxID=2045244 RepID=A0A2W0HD57_9BACI|nr:MerR family transcriptional regulator [Alteribacter lacisalsi]PYZ99137.1 hypothetical protein CR205_02545 [Alteribacter lacisalsi]
MDTAVEVIRFVQKDEVEEALWLLNRVQIQRGKEKRAVAEALELAGPGEEEGKRFKTGEAAERMEVTPSAIRYWERSGYLYPVRNPESGYRMFDRLQLARISLLKALNHPYYTSESADLKLKFKKPELKGEKGCLVLADEVMKLLHMRNRNQVRAYSSLEDLFVMLGK